MDKRVWRMLRSIGSDKRMLLILILRSPFDLVNAIVTSNMLERFLRVTEQGQKDKLMETFLLFLLFTVLLFAYNMTVWMTISVTGTVDMHKGYRRKMLGTILRQSHDKIQANPNGYWITRLGTDIDRTCDYLTAPLNFMHFFIASICFMGSSMILIQMSLPLFLIAIMATIPFFAFNILVILKDVAVYKKRSQEKLAEYTGWVEPVVNSHTSIKVFGGEELVMEKVEEISLGILRENMKGHKRQAASMLCNIFSGSFGYLLLMLAGNSMIGSGIRDLAMLTKITQYRGEMMKNIMMISNCVGNMRTNLAGVERVSEILESDCVERKDNRKRCIGG